jgi:shikimate kinase
MAEGRNIILTGYRATGKSLVGRQLGARLAWEFVDMDRVIETRQGCTIREMVAAHGWPFFRQLERALLRDLAGRRNLVIATGGGAIMHQEEWCLLKESGLVIWLTADRPTICRRLAGDDRTGEQRPALTDQGLEAEIDSVLRQREPMYREGSHLVVDTCGRTPEAIVEIIIDRWEKDEI